MPDELAQAVTRWSKICPSQARRAPWPLVRDAGDGTLCSLGLIFKPPDGRTRRKPFSFVRVFRVFCGSNRFRERATRLLPSLQAHAASPCFGLYTRNRFFYTPRAKGMPGSEPPGGLISGEGNPARFPWPLLPGSIPEGPASAPGIFYCLDVGRGRIFPSAASRPERGRSRAGPHPD